jgi:[ribosomal protein S18]-alanine N-acetyltransferase
VSLWRPAKPDELSRIWPAARAARVTSTAEELRALYEAAPWSVRVSERGDALVLKPWRAHVDALALKGAFAPAVRMASLIDEALAVARSQGYAGLVSPLVPQSAIAPYLEKGAYERHRVVALQGGPDSVAAKLEHRGDVRLRQAIPADVAIMCEIDSECFSDFWRYGVTEMAEAMERERVIVAEGDGRLVGYASSSVGGMACTLGRLAVTAHARRLGVGSALLRDSAVWAAERRAAVLSLCTQEENTVSRSFYAKAGLVEVDEPYAVVLIGTHGGAHADA